MDPARDFLLNTGGDMAVVNGDFAAISGEDAVPQGIQTRTLMFQGESFLDKSVGVAWIEKILIKDPDESEVRSLIASAIAKTPDVTAVLGTGLDEESDRSASISYQVTTAYSAEPLAGKVETP